MNYDKPRTSAKNKQLGTKELTYVEITKIEQGKGGTKVIHCKHLMTGTPMTHDWSVDKNREPNIYDKLQVGKMYVITQYLMSHKYGGRWIWKKAFEVTKTEGRIINERCGYVNVDWQLYDDICEVILTKRHQRKQALIEQEAKTQTDLLIF